MEKTLNQYFDHTILKQDARRSDVIRICREAAEYGFYAVCVNSSYVELAAAELAGTDIKIAAVVGFPLGACTTASKAFETDEACRLGAAEIDMVLHVGALKDGRDDYVKEDIRTVAEAAKKYGAIVKVILETCLLSDDEITTACHLAEAAGAAFVKTSTGFSVGGATAHHVKLMKETVGDRLAVKASGGIRDLAGTMTMILSGADRIGASASVEIVKEQENSRIGEKEIDGISGNCN